MEAQSACKISTASTEQHFDRAMNLQVITERLQSDHNADLKLPNFT